MHSLRRHLVQLIWREILGRELTHLIWREILGGELTRWNVGLLLNTHGDLLKNFGRNVGIAYIHISLLTNCFTGNNTKVPASGYFLAAETD